MAELSEKAMQLDPNSINVRVAHAWKCFLSNDREGFIKDFDWCIRAHPNSPMRMGSLGFHLSLFGDWERGKSILDQMMIRNLNFPLYYYGATTLYYYRKNDYDAALWEARQYDIPFLFWGPMLRAAIYGQLNSLDDARPHMDQVKQLKPDFEEKAHYLISRFVKEKSLVDHVIDGLRKAGMSV
jgi:adenylate cyclase